MSDQPALELAKRLNEKIEGFVGYSRSHHDIGLELMRAAQSACTAIEQLSNETESLTSENTRLRARLRREVDLVSRCDDCGAELYESAGYFECDDMCQKCFDQWNGMPFEEIATAIEKSQPQPPSHKGED